MEKRKISVLLVRQHSTFSNLVYLISGRGYTHASISLDDSGEEFYSFNFKGFCIERPRNKKRRSERKSAYYQFEVSESDYDSIKKEITSIIENRKEYRYSRLGVILCLLHIPHKIRKTYFCSQFVAEMLGACKTIQLRKNASLYLPNSLTNELVTQPCLYKVSYNTL